ncbi:MAG: type I methionyl aminopeptidase [Chloroflexi bacterium]|nr:type I methionyl aminopeptidase [Chloroflexota bacterium]
MVVTVKSRDEIAAMRRAGIVVAQVLEAVERELRPGLATRALDEIAAQTVARLGATAAFKGLYGFPASICVSTNDEVIHGIPSERVLDEGDIVSLDFGALIDTWYADAAVTLPVGRVTTEAQRLLDCGRAALDRGIGRALAGGRVGDISDAIESYAVARTLGVVREYVGHGIGQRLHEAPPVPNFGAAGRGPLLRPGMTLAIEPMLALGSGQTQVHEDGWTVVTADGSLAAHFEHTVAIAMGSPEILTKPPS